WRAPGWLAWIPVSGVVQVSSSLLKSKCVPALIPPAPHRGGGTPDDRAGKPHRTAPPACRGAARDQGEQGQERRCRRRRAEVVTFQDQQVRAGQDRLTATGSREAAGLLRDHRSAPHAPARTRRGRGPEG